jgi:hypothetical protein
MPKRKRCLVRSLLFAILLSSVAMAYDRDTSDRIDYLVHVEYRDELLTRIDTVRARAVTRIGGQTYVALCDGFDIWVDRARIIKRIVKG